MLKAFLFTLKLCCVDGQWTDYTEWLEQNNVDPARIERLVLVQRGTYCGKAEVMALVVPWDSDEQKEHAANKARRCARELAE